MIKFRNLRQFNQAMNDLPQDIHDATVNGLQASMKDWMERSYNVAAEDTGNLKNSMETEIDQAKLEGQLVTNAYSSKGFNYAYYLHEVGSQKGYRARRPGRTLEWLKETQDEERSIKIVEEVSEEKLRKKGW